MADDSWHICLLLLKSLRGRHWIYLYFFNHSFKEPAVKLTSETYAEQSVCSSTITRVKGTAKLKGVKGDKEFISTQELKL